MSNKMIYLDYAATTPVDPQVVKVMSESLSNNFGNPASRSHQFGWKAEKSIDLARKQVAELINADPREIIWTSGATESDNLAIKGAASFYKGKGKHIITSLIEHKAVLDTCRQLESEGYSVTYLEPDSDGLVQPNSIKNAIREDTILVSIMHANNEIGTIQDIKAIGEITRANNIIFHVDAAQSAGKIPLDVTDVNVDLLSMSSHKMYGPKGIGALFVRRKPRARIHAQIHGGGHERGMRSGTLPTHQIIGMGEACRIAKEQMTQDNERIRMLRDKLWQGVKDIPETRLNGHYEQRLPGFLNASFNFVEGESLMMGLKELAISSGSACTSASLEPSYVLRALGLSDELAHSSLRFSIGRFTTNQDIDDAISLVRGVVQHLRDMSPLWEMHQDGIDLNTVQWAAH
jgi:cysteine desulfurase